ncbi:hypothetical protein OZX65_01595 [Leuconostocaceae bacterium ESL0723]|nr:hypothetical protein OZX65_01595 [Leuconostocaceae bacterium ESL0723]
MSNLKYLFKKVPVDTSIEDYRRIILTRHIAFVIYFVTVLGILMVFGHDSYERPVIPLSQIFSEKSLIFLAISLVCMAVLCAWVNYDAKHQSTEHLQEKKIKETDERMNSNDLQATKMTMAVLAAVALVGFTYCALVGQQTTANIICLTLIGTTLLKLIIKSYLDKHS